MRPRKGTKDFKYIHGKLDLYQLKIWTKGKPNIFKFGKKAVLITGVPLYNFNQKQKLIDEFNAKRIELKEAKRINFKVIDGGYYCTKHGLKNCTECLGNM